MTSVQNEHTNTPQFEVADIFNRYWEEYTEDHNTSSHVNKIVHYIRRCRTSKLGSHKISCSNSDCNHKEISYNSCRNRHCPKCQGSKQIAWVNSRLKELLPVPYFHSIFTMPHILNNLALFNQRIIYELFFKATSYTLNLFALDEKYLGGQTGFFGILHTWGQNLGYHVHIHYIVAGCGLLKNQNTVKRLPYQEKFLFPVEAMSKTVRDQFIKHFKKAYYNGELHLPGDLERFSEIDVFEDFCDALGKEAWYCYTKPPFSGPDKVVAYIGRYTHRVAISNNRLQSIDDHQIQFTWRDYKDDYKIKEITLPVNTFIQRLLYHVLPYGFRKIRHYGFLSGSNHNMNIAILRSFFENIYQSNIETIQSIKAWVERFQGCLDRLCPVCNKGTLMFEFSFDSW